VSVEAFESRSMGPCCQVDVEDDGTGFSDDARAHIQAGIRVSRWGGRGIGVRTARDWFEEYGGSLEIMSGPSRFGGAHIRVILPVLADPDAEASARDGTETATTGVLPT
jgi:nitrogen fixation/metabolism regulation signal transduction histidine kinase